MDIEKQRWKESTKMSLGSVNRSSIQTFSKEDIEKQRLKESTEMSLGSVNHPSTQPFSKEDFEKQRLKESTEMLLGSVEKPHIQPLSIAVVPGELGKWNENAYIPKVVSIGPRYKEATRDLRQMEQIKWSYMTKLLHRTEDPTRILNRCTDVVWELDAPVRASYVDEIKLDRYELSKIMLIDGCFLLELLISGSKEINGIPKSSIEEGSEGRVVRLEEGLITDLILLENQIPFDILRALAANIFPEVFVFDKSKQKEGGASIENDLMPSFLGFENDQKEGGASNRYDNVGHFLEHVYVSIFENLQVQQNQESLHSETRIPFEGEPHVDVKACLNRCATKLQAAGITIKLKTEDKDKHSDVDVKFNPLTGFNFDIEFKNGKLEIPRLHITERAEARWRNFIAWEHHKMKEKNSINKIGHKTPFSTYKCKCTSAALLFNGLICCANDVQLLKDKKVIVDHSNMSNQDLVGFFRSIPKGVDPNIIDSNYDKMFHVLNTYSATPSATRIPIILRHYSTRIPEIFHVLNTYSATPTRIQKFLRRGYNFAASIVSIFTLIQTIYAVISYHHPKK